MKDALKEFKAMFKEEIWPGIVRSWHLGHG